MKARDKGFDRDSPWLQAGRVGFNALYVVTFLAALAWAVSNIREVGPENQAVVFRMGAMKRVQNAGLLVAWPRPFEQVVLIPSPDRVLQWRVQALLRAGSSPASAPADFTEPVDDDDDFASDIEEQHAESSSTNSNDALAGSGYLLTGDGGVVQLDVTILYKVTDPYDYVLEAEHVVPALDRLATRSAIVLCSERDLDSILVARPELIGADNDAAERRERLRAELVDSINRSLAALKSGGAGLGIEIERVDIQSTLPDAAVDAFNAVLTASQQAEQAIAAAQNDAAKDMQAATQAANQTIQAAHASADEHLAKAKADTATIASLAGTNEGSKDPGLPLRLYRDRISSILSQAGSVTTVDPAADSRLILQGADK
jgi:regulator of protease activity HflC (stomatin/prohibitin superfamily)